MRGLIGWLFLLPLAFAFWLTITIANGCARRESGSWRFLGVLSSLIIGGICIQVGYWFTEEGMTILGWIDMIGGGSMALLGTWTALVGTRKEIELREEMEKLGKEMEEEERNLAKEEAKKILEQGEIDDYERLDTILGILDDRGSSIEAGELFYKLKYLKRKLAKRQKGNSN